jgi:hypothetical protein
MAYCALGLIFGYRHFFQQFGITERWRRVAYWLITFYVTASLPGHFNFLVLGDTRYFDVFPWWFSPVIMAVYVLMSTYFLTLSESGIPPRVRAQETQHGKKRSAPTVSAY